MTKALDIRIAPLARDCRVIVDGLDISDLVHRIEIVCDIHEQPTQVTLSCHKLGGEPFTIKGTLQEDG